MLIIWLQGIWLPQHGYSFSQTPLWAGIYMIPLTSGSCSSGPLAGVLSDRYGAQGVRHGGLVISRGQLPATGAAADELRLHLFRAAHLHVRGRHGLFFAPNQAAVMNSLPPEQRGAGAGMLNTFQNSATGAVDGPVLHHRHPGPGGRPAEHLYRGLVAAGVASGAAHLVAHEPPIGSLFSAFLGYNPVKELLGPTGALQHLTAQQAAYRHRSVFFPSLIEAAFRRAAAPRFRFRCRGDAHSRGGLRFAGRRYVHTTHSIADELAEGASDSASVSAFAGGSPFEISSGEPVGERE